MEILFLVTFCPLLITFQSNEDKKMGEIAFHHREKICPLCIIFHLLSSSLDVAVKYFCSLVRHL